MMSSADDGSVPGLASKDVSRINQRISNAASHLVRGPLAVQTENVLLENKRIVHYADRAQGDRQALFRPIGRTADLDDRRPPGGGRAGRPAHKNGVIWLKTGADKRLVNSKEGKIESLEITH